MSLNQLKNYYEKDSDRFAAPINGMNGRDLYIYPLLDGLSGSLLEYGCGAGSLLLGLGSESRFSKVTGIDISKKALDNIETSAQKMETFNENKLTLIESTDDQLLEIEDNSIDALISVATLEHVIDPYKVLDELYRIAKPSATLITSVPNYAYIKHIIYLLLGKQPLTGTDQPVEKWREEGWDGMHLHTFTRSSFCTLLKDCGWQADYVTGSGEKFNSLGIGILRRKFPGLLSGELVVKCSKIPAKTPLP